MNMISTTNLNLFLHIIPYHHAQPTRFGLRVPSSHLEGRVAFVISRDQRPVEETARRTKRCVSVLLLFCSHIGGYVGKVRDDLEVYRFNR